METFTYEDLRRYMTDRLFYKKYQLLSEFIRQSINKDPDFNLYDYLYKRGNTIIFTAKNKQLLLKKRDEYFKNKFRQMKFGVVDRVLAWWSDYRDSYP